MSDRSGTVRTSSTRYQVRIGSRDASVEVIESTAGLSVRIDDGPARSVVVRRPKSDELYLFVVDNEVFGALVGGGPTAFSVVIEGQAIEAHVQDERAARLAQAAAVTRHTPTEASVQAPMPGLVIAVNVEPGQVVSKGTSLVILQAMKMENELTARSDGTVKDVLVSPGQAVDLGQTLVTLE